MAIVPTLGEWPDSSASSLIEVLDPVVREGAVEAADWLATLAALLPSWLDSGIGFRAYRSLVAVAAVQMTLTGFVQ